jgi:hypothetical protein
MSRAGPEEPALTTLSLGKRISVAHDTHFRVTTCSCGSAFGKHKAASAPQVGQENSEREEPDTIEFSNHTTNLDGKPNNREPTCQLPTTNNRKQTSKFQIPNFQSQRTNPEIRTSGFWESEVGSWKSIYLKPISLTG